MGELSKESFWLYKTNLSVSQNHYWHLFFAFSMHTWLEVNKRKYTFCDES